MEVVVKCYYVNIFVHVIVGTLFILYSTVRIYSYHSTSSHHVGLESAIAYWHENKNAL